ncbi:TniQ family protein [Mycolicibacterium sp.]|uniref:TniQ family protein n=1 Tax=Mycolicibacterium sp. TaxID=2320850 RepID=UPI0037CC884A
MDTSVRTLPMHTDPVNGEALDSWLEAISHRHAAAWGDLLDAVGLAAPTGAATPWLIQLIPAEAAALSLATRKPADQLHAMTLARYDGTGLRIRQHARVADRSFPWSRARFSRFCPDCLRDDGGRWQLFWRLGWAFACLRHQCLLVDECPCCGQRQRERSFPADLIPDPGRCALPAAGATGRAPQRCGAELATAATLHLPVDHPALCAQQTVRDVIDSGTAIFGIYHRHPQYAEAMLSDVRAVAGRVLGYATDADLARILPTDLVETYQVLKSRSDEQGAAPVPDDKPGLAAPAHAATAAVGVTTAIEILASSDTASAGDRLRWLIDGGRANGLNVNTSNVGWGRGTTTVLTAAQITGLAPYLKPSEQLRYRIGTSMPSKPSHNKSDIAALVAKLPAALWPSWALRLAPPALDYTHLSTALPCAVLLVNSRLSLSEVTQEMGRRDIDGHSLSHTLQQLRGDRHWSHLRDAIVRLADYLYTHDCPIDYRRRRGLDYSALLGDSTWRRICRGLDLRSGGDKRLQMARCQLYARVSGSPTRYAPWFINVNEFSAPLANFPALLTPDLAAALDAEAQQFLQDNGIDEPVAWNPPDQLLSELTLPGCDPHAINLAAMHSLLRKAVAISDIATQLGTSRDAVRYALTMHPAPELQQGQAFRPAPALSRLARALPPETLADLYQDQGLSLRQIAEKYRAERKVVARLARQYGIAVRPAQGRRRLEEIDRDWLYTEYVVNRRALPELAAEKGMSTMNMSRWAKTHGIPLRGRGGPSHTANIKAADAARDAPALLRPALTSIGGAERLSRFAAAATYSSLTGAASALGLHQPVLHGQIARLEAELGGPLFTRAERGHPMALTYLGTRVLHAWTGRNPGGIGEAAFAGNAEEAPVDVVNPIPTHKYVRDTN